MRTSPKQPDPDPTSAEGRTELARRQAEDPFSDASEWMTLDLARASFTDVEDAENPNRDAAIAILNAKSMLHAAVKQRQIAVVLAEQNDTTARRLFWATVALVVATIVLAASTIALPFLEHRFTTKEPTVVVVTQTP